jgi:uncharacterized repeat protein (TIGR01451 family)
VTTIKTKSLLSVTLAAGMTLVFSFCTLPPAFAAESSIPDSSMAEVEEDTPVEETVTEKKIPEESVEEAVKEEPKETAESDSGKTNLKPAAFATESTVTAAVLEEPDDSEETNEELSKARTTTSSEVSAASTSPVLSLKKEQAVNDGERTSETVSAKLGDTITYYLTVTNSEESASAAKSISIVDNIPEGMTYVEGSASGEAAVSNGIIRWTVENLAAGQSVLVSYQAKIPEDASAASYSGTANASCYVESLEDSPKTGDENHSGRWYSVAGVSAAAMLTGACQMIYIKRHG